MSPFKNGAFQTIQLRWKVIINFYSDFTLRKVGFEGLST